MDFSYYDRLCGVAAGGLPLLVKLVNLTKKPYVVVKCNSYHERVRNELYVELDHVNVWNERILVVDDIADSGLTLKKVKEGLLDRGAASVEILTLFYKPQSIVVPEWYVQEIENHQWVIFPWE